jgi:DNA-binding response OmpR family regulator
MAYREYGEMMASANATVTIRNQILLVDDHPVNLKALDILLTAQGYAVRTAPNGSLALILAQKFPPDLILLDIRMPGMDGFETCHRLKGDDRTRDIPIIFLSALDELKDKIKAISVGGADYIIKPFAKADVLARVKTRLAFSRMRKRAQ